MAGGETFALLGGAVLGQLGAREDEQQALRLRLLPGGAQQVVEGVDVQRHFLAKSMTIAPGSRCT